jgi:hypothetical protein
MSPSESSTILAVTRKAFIGLLTVFALIVGVANALAADRVFLGNTPGVPLTASADPGTVQTLGVLRQQVASRGTMRVIVGVLAAFAPEGLMAAASVTQQRDEIATTQAAVLDKVPSLKQKPETIKRFETIPFMALEVTPAELEALASLTEITSIEEDRLAAPVLAESVPLIGGTAAWASGYTGAGQTVAILDTGVDKIHPFLTGKVVSEACYSSNYAPYSASTICPEGATSSTLVNSAMPYLSGVCPAGECDHGTHVSGIAAGNGAGPGVSYSGVAKDASILAIQIFSRFDSAATCGGAAYSPCVLTFNSDQILGLQRVYALRSTYSIAAVNMSIGGGSYSSQATCDSDYSAAKAAIDNLRAVNIATVIAAGNSGYISSLGAPGCISSAISVGATWDAAGYANGSLGTSSVNAIAYYSNSASFLNLLAPGSLITSSVPGGGYASWQGTSMATPHVTGAWALLKQKSASITVPAALTALTSTGVSVTDPRNGIVKPRIRVDAALSAIGGGTTYTLTVAKSGTGSGTVTSNPAGISCGGTCSASYASGTSVTLTETPASGSTFAGWSGACSGTGTTCTGTMNSAVSVTATFALADDGFPSGGSLPAGWIQPFGSNLPWVVTNDFAYAGSFSLKSGHIVNSQRSDISYMANFSAGNVTFARKVSSETYFDFLEFYIDGVLKGSWSGELDWTVVSFPISAGSHTLLWRYRKDGSVSAGGDAAWIDRVQLPSNRVPFPLEAILMLLL